MEFFKKQNFKQFAKSEVDLSDFDKDYIIDWNNRTFFAQMLDAWGEMNYTHQCYKDYLANPNSSTKNNMISHANKMHDVCNLIVKNPNVYKEEADTLRFAEWQFYNYIFGYSKDDSCIKWFNQWCFDANLNLV